MDPQPKVGASKYLILIAVIAAVIIAVSLMGKKQSEPTQTTEETANSVATPTQTETATPTTNDGAKAASAAAGQTAEVDYTDQGFTPKEVTIKIGDTVKFVNKSSEDMWVGSAMHPSHAIYSGTTMREHCPDTALTAFDQCGAGNEFYFTFNKIGSWGYHNHLDASMFGKVIVQ